MKNKFLLIIIILFCIVGCDYQNNSNINKNTVVELNIVELPIKTDYYLGEDIDLTGLVVEASYSNGSKIIIDDYSIVYPKIKVGNNTILVKYDNIITSFQIIFSNKNDDIEINDEKIPINNISNSLSCSIDNIDFLSYDLRFEDVQYGVKRNKDMMIVYDEKTFIQTNAYGYEISVDEYGKVVKVGINVELLPNGYIISGHGVSSKLLQNINVGDICIFIDNNVYVYQNVIIDDKSNIYFKLIELKKDLEFIEDISTYNKYACELNAVIDEFNNVKNFLNDDFNAIYRYLCQISNDVKVLVSDEIHDYNYKKLDYGLKQKLNEDINNSINFINYSDKLYYGGFRNQDTIVYYDKENYRTRNPYGYEIAVDKNNVVVDKKILVDLPEGGYILSGHGTGAEFIKNNISIGNFVQINDDKIEFYKDLGANEYNKMISKRNDLVMRLNEHINMSIPHDYEYIEKLIDHIDNSISKYELKINTCYDVINISKCVRELEEYYGVVYSQLIDHKVLETRGMWYYPFSYPQAYDDTTLEGVINTLDLFKKMGFNEIIILPFCGNYCLFESDYFYYYDKLNDYSYGEYGSDYLKCFITEAHKRDIVVNAFTQTFRCYEEGAKVFNESHYQLQYDGSLSRGQIYYYDICNDYVQESLINWYKELVSLYDFDKVEYDIIRYPVSYLRNFNDIEEIPIETLINDPGYTEYSMQKFMTMYNLQGDLKTLIRQSKDVRLKWLEFKENELIKFITNATNEMKNIKPELIISAAVLNDYDSAKDRYLQDAKKWLNLGIIDMIEPMVYSDDYLFVIDKIDYYNDEFKEYDVRIGLSYGLTVNELMMQLEASSENGYILFHTRDYLNEKYFNLLKHSFHFDFISNISSIKNIKAAVKKDLIDKIENFYEIKNNKDYDLLIQCLEEDDYKTFKEKLFVESDDYMKSYLSKIVEQLECLE